MECSCPQWCSISTSVVFYRLIVIPFILTLDIWIISPSNTSNEDSCPPKTRVTRLKKPFYTLNENKYQRNSGRSHHIRGGHVCKTPSNKGQIWLDVSGSERVFQCIRHEWSFLFKRRRGSGTFMSAIMFLLSSVCVCVCFWIDGVALYADAAVLPLQNRTAYLMSG